MNCDNTDCIHYKVCEEWKSLGNDNYINDSYGNCDYYSAPYNPSKKGLPKTFDGHTLGDFVVRDNGISRIIKVDDYAGYTTELVLPKAVFIEAYNKYIKGEAKG